MRLIVALIAFLLWAPPSLVGLPFAALLVAGRRAIPLAGMIGAASITLMVLSGGGPMGRLRAVTNVYTILVTVAFVGALLSRPGPWLREAYWALGAGALGTGLLVQVMWGLTGWSVLAWQVTREMGLTMRYIVEQVPQAIGIYEPVVRLLSIAWPIVLLLQMLAGLALAWHLYQRLAARQERRQQQLVPVPAGATGAKPV